MQRRRRKIIYSTNICQEGEKIICWNAVKIIVELRAPISSIHKLKLTEKCIQFIYTPTIVKGNSPITVRGEGENCCFFLTLELYR
jgi:hypothetical protein